MDRNDSLPLAASSAVQRQRHLRDRQTTVCLQSEFSHVRCVRAVWSVRARQDLRCVQRVRRVVCVRCACGGQCVSGEDVVRASAHLLKPVLTNWYLRLAFAQPSRAELHRAKPPCAEPPCAESHLVLYRRHCRQTSCCAPLCHARTSLLQCTYD